MTIFLFHFHPVPLFHITYKCRIPRMGLSYSTAPCKSFWTCWSDQNLSSWPFHSYLYIIVQCWLTVAPDGGGWAGGLWGVCEQSCSWGGARPPQTADGVPPGWHGAPPPGQRVHYTGAPTAWGGGVSPTANVQHKSHTVTHTSPYGLYTTTHAEDWYYCNGRTNTTTDRNKGSLSVTPNEHTY